MRPLRFYLLLLSVVLLNPSCEKDNAVELGGYFEFEVRTSNNPNRLSIPSCDIVILEGNSPDLDFRWESVDSDIGVKRWTSNKLLYGSYSFEYYLQYKDNDGSTTSIGPLSHSFQIFPGETTKFSRKF
ncbi:hypothetical protein [Croceimicrobium hydrocarbonivorans]|uniref:Uncharacterized protein n=1 Tax=Croceimicrobium hydrocarbonivorans TaxID=2761580 RepID=A0A7H0VHH6_9FLAO|nr:hypothetical protein [Croceimicrobium hydrocarbonivorans]QNR25174.1 hypothetical protein H4K34_04865 [Croceimicrobium hydrocarbonivorans]